jgi:fructokinase
VPLPWRLLERLASGTALKKRWNQASEQIPATHPAWDLEAKYLALGLVNYICTLSPQIIIMGGGVMKKAGLLSSVRQKTVDLLNNYIRSSRITENIEGYVVGPTLGDLAGVLGAIALAQQKLRL